MRENIKSNFFHRTTFSFMYETGMGLGCWPGLVYTGLGTHVLSPCFFSLCGFYPKVLSLLRMAVGAPATMLFAIDSIGAPATMLFANDSMLFKR